MIGCYGIGLSGDLMIIRRMRYRAGGSRRSGELSSFVPSCVRCPSERLRYIGATSGLWMTRCIVCGWVIRWSRRVYRLR